jgi:hypothetical protein
MHEYCRRPDSKGLPLSVGAREFELDTLTKGLASWLGFSGLSAGFSTLLYIV